MKAKAKLWEEEDRAEIDLEELRRLITLDNKAISNKEREVKLLERDRAVPELVFDQLWLLLQEMETIYEIQLLPIMNRYEYIEAEAKLR